MELYSILDAAFCFRDLLRKILTISQVKGIMIISYGIKAKMNVTRALKLSDRIMPELCHAFAANGNRLQLH
jgi:hypothetical protein